MPFDCPLQVHACLRRERILGKNAKISGTFLVPYFVHTYGVLDLGPFQHVPLRGGFVLAEVHLSATPLLDPLERAATAQTIVRRNQFYIFLRADLDERELSISLYHEVLEAATVAAEQPPETVMELNEADFEEAAQSAHARLGIASPETLNQMLAEFGF